MKTRRTKTSSLAILVCAALLSASPWIASDAQAQATTDVFDADKSSEDTGRRKKPKPDDDSREGPGEGDGDRSGDVGDASDDADTDATGSTDSQDSNETTAETGSKTGTDTGEVTGDTGNETGQTTSTTAGSDSDPPAGDKNKKAKGDESTGTLPETGATTPTDPLKEKGEKEKDDKKATGLGAIQSEFRFGSYGRARAATNFRGGTAQQVNVVGNGSRIDESNYAELDFMQFFLVPGEQVDYNLKVVTTLAFLDDLFHLTGDFDQTFAIRNLFADAFFSTSLWEAGFWAGSRMYRGDDIYLLDFWPLDNLNTLGGGVRFVLKPSFGRTALKFHAGTNNLDNPYQRQVISVPGQEFGTDQVLFLNRQRLIMSYRLQQDVWLSKDDKKNPNMGAKLVLYGESHDLDEGTRRLEDGLTFEQLPEETGGVFGTELGFWTRKGLFDGSFANLFLRYSWGLAAYGEFGVPRGVNLNDTAEGARQFMMALSSAIETPYYGSLIGAYYKTFQDADNDDEDFDDYWEAVIAYRGHVYLTRHIHPGFEVSYQVRRPDGVYSPTGRFEVPVVTKLSGIMAFTLDKQMYSRPQLRVLYTQSRLNESARVLYNPEDPRRDLAVQHYFGVQAEWWFNSASLFRPK